MRDQKYSRLGGMDERVKISKVRWKGWNSRYTQGQMEWMNELEFSHLGGIGDNWKYSRLVRMDGRLQILQVWWQGCKIGNNQGQVEWMRDQKYSKLVGRVERLKIFMIRWKG